MWGVCSIMKRLEVVDEEMKIVLLLLDQELANCRYVQREAGHPHHSNSMIGTEDIFLPPM